MRKRPGRPIVWCASIGLAIGLGCHIAAAEEVSDVINPKTASNQWVSDMAGILSAAGKDSINRIIDELERRSGGEIAVVTVRTTGDRDPRGFATELFNSWGVGKQGKDDGVLMLVVVDAHRVEVETGYGAEARLPDGLVGRILDAEVVPRFKSGDWDGGVIGGVREMARILEGGAPSDSVSDTDRYGSVGSHWRTLPDDLPEPTTRRMPLWPLLAIAGSGGLVAWWVDRNRYCRKCRRRMRRLNDQQEDAYLSSGAVFEESLRSVDHRVWRCDHCSIRKIEHRVQWFSGYVACPKCRRRTLRTSSRTIEEATYERAGRQEVTRICALPTCGFRDVGSRSIPRLERSSSSDGGSWSGSSFGDSGGSSSSSSSGSGSFGGGSSGGGGAGRGW